MEKQVVIKLIDKGQQLGPRSLGVQIKDEIIQMLESGEADGIVVDLDGVDILSTGFCKELFGGLWLHLKEQFSSTISIQVGPDQQGLRASIMRGIESAHHFG